MKTKSLFSLLLLTFVAVSVAMAVRKIGTKPDLESTAIAVSQNSASATKPLELIDQLANSHFSAVYFHAPHRCPTCRKIESFAHEALTPDINAGDIAWQMADYTSGKNSALVDHFQVFTSTVVLVEVQGGQVVRWKNLEEVWNHTHDQADFTTFIHQAWSEFKAS